MKTRDYNEYRNIRPAHKYEIEKAIQDKGLDLLEFNWGSRISGSDRKVVISVLEHEKAKAHFTFDVYGSNGIWSARAPGLNGPKDQKDGFNSWEEQRAFALEWLDLVKEDLHAPDLRATISQERALLETSSAFDTENTPFSPEEQRVIATRLDEIQRLLVQSIQAQNLSAEETATRIKRIEEEIEYSKQATRRLGRKDWKNIIISTVIGIVISTAYSSEFRPLIVKALSDLIQFIAGHSLQLPPI